MIRRPPRSTRKESSAASDVYKRQRKCSVWCWTTREEHVTLSLIHISEPTRH
ncbi:hypothetical protein [Staphylococcus aureus]